MWLVLGSVPQRIADAFPAVPHQLSVWRGICFICCALFPCRICLWERRCGGLRIADVVVADTEGDGRVVRVEARSGNGQFL